MITEDYVSFEVAKLLKEKGFDAECRAAYTNYGKLFTTQIQQYITNVLCSKGYLWDCTAPTYQMAMKWLREKGIECVVIPIWNTTGKQYRSYVLSDLGDKYKDNYDSYSDNISYEEAAEAALRYSLENLIQL